MYVEGLFRWRPSFPVLGVASTISMSELSPIGLNEKLTKMFRPSFPGNRTVRNFAWISNFTRLGIALVSKCSNMKSKRSLKAPLIILCPDQIWNSSVHSLIRTIDSLGSACKWAGKICWIKFITVPFMHPWDPSGVWALKTGRKN